MSQDKHHGSVQSYTIGFFISIILTIAAFYIVDQQTFTGLSLAIALSILAIGQLFVQLVLFLHLGREKSPRWNLMAFSFMFMTVLIVVVGSLWIMSNLESYHGQSLDVDSYIMEEENIYR